MERAAHSIKGPAEQFGAVKLSNLAFSIETLAIQGKIDQVSLLLSNLTHTQQDAAKAMQQALKQTP